MYEEFDDIVIPLMIDLLIDMIRHASLDLNEASATIATRAICSIYIANYDPSPEIESRIAQHIITASRAIDDLHQESSASNMFRDRVRRCKMRNHRTAILCDIRRKLNDLARDAFRTGNDVRLEVRPDSRVDVDILLIYTFFVIRSTLVAIADDQSFEINIVEEACVRMSYMLELIQLEACKSGVSGSNLGMVIYNKYVSPWICALDSNYCIQSRMQYSHSVSMFMGYAPDFKRYKIMFGDSFGRASVGCEYGFSYISMLKHIISEIRAYIDIYECGDRREKQICDYSGIHISFRLKLL